MSLVADSVKPTIKASFVGNLLAGYVRRGGDDMALLKSVGLNPVDGMGDTRISVAKFYELSVAIERAMGDEMLGFLAQPVPPGSIGKLMGIVVKLPTLGDALEAISDFYSLFNNGQPLLEARKVSGKTQISLVPENDFQNRAPYFIQRMLLTSYKTLCWLAKTRFHLVNVYFTFPVAGDLDEFRFVFDCSSINTADFNRIAFDSDVLSLPVLQDRGQVSNFIENFSIYTLLWPSFDSLSARIREIVGSDITEGFPGFDEVASGLGMSPQTLSRRLHDSGISYQLIKDNIRRDAAIALLVNTDLSIKGIAYRVGFKEAGSFSKAFKNWVGVSPRDFRERLGDSE